ncbi:hypothetical protein [Nocardiopsis sp. MG754419]|nr:hypothetical protein [Nocardiopsis sp. MG754419]
MMQQRAPRRWHVRGSDNAFWERLDVAGPVVLQRVLEGLKALPGVV